MTSLADPVIEDGIKTIEGRRITSMGSVRIAKTAQFQSFVAVKKGIWPGETTEIGENTYVCSFVNIGHNSKIGNNCFIAPGAQIVGYCTIGDHVYIGANAVICKRARIGNWCKIRAGEIISYDVPDKTYVGKNGKMARNRDAQ